MNIVRSLPKRKLIDFLQNAKEDEDYTFRVDISPDDAINFVHRMRVELSRFREKVRERDHIPKHFKMLFKKVQSVKDNKDQCDITLCRSLSNHDVSNTLDNIFDEIAGGKKLNV